MLNVGGMQTNLTSPGTLTHEVGSIIIFRVIDINAVRNEVHWQIRTMGLLYWRCRNIVALITTP